MHTRRVLGTAVMTGSVAEWSKALVLGTSLSGRGFESHRCQIFCHLSDLKAWTSRAKHWLEMRGIEPLASRMRIERSTTELHPHIIKLKCNIGEINSPLSEAIKQAKEIVLTYKMQVFAPLTY